MAVELAVGAGGSGRSPQGGLGGQRPLDAGIEARVRRARRANRNAPDVEQMDVGLAPWAERHAECARHWCGARPSKSAAAGSRLPFGSDDATKAETGTIRLPKRGQLQTPDQLGASRARLHQVLIQREQRDRRRPADEGRPQVGAVRSVWRPSYRPVNPTASIDCHRPDAHPIARLDVDKAFTSKSGFPRPPTRMGRPGGNPIAAGLPEGRRHRRRQRRAGTDESDST